MITVKNITKYHMILSTGNVYGELLTFLMFRITYYRVRFLLSSFARQRIPFNVLWVYMFSSLSWKSVNEVQVNSYDVHVSGTAQVDSNLKFYVLAFRLIILLRACDACVSLGTLTWHSTHFWGRLQMCTQDNRLDWSTVETIRKSFSTEVKFVQLKGRGYKERLVCWLNISFTTELMRWMLTIKSKRFQGKYSTCMLIWNHFYSWSFTVNDNVTFLVTWPFNVHRKQ